MRLHVDQPARARDRRMIRRCLTHLKTQKRPQCQGVGCPPRNSALRIDALEISNQQRTKVNSRGQSRTSHLRIKTQAGIFSERIKAPLVQQPVQTFIEWMADRSCKRSRFDPDWLLLLVRSTLAQRHESIVRRFALSSQDNHRVAPRAASGWPPTQAAA